jgi:hypothetical protein
MASRPGGASHQRMEKIRDQVSQVCRGWPAGRVAEITAGQDVIIVSTPGQEVAAPAATR